MANTIDQVNIQEAKKKHLRYMSDTIPGYSRKPWGKGFSFLYSNGKLIEDTGILDHIEKLVIPPAWTDVWVNPFENGHIQVTARDEKGRKQYIYHPEWNKLCQETKFEKLISFAEVLPTLRRDVRFRMGERGLTKEKIVAVVVWLLQKTFIRVGNPEYAKENDSYGLTTMKGRHVDIKGDTITFEFIGKSGQAHVVDVSHPVVARTVRRLEELPGYELFKYVDANGVRHVVDSEDINEYLKSVAGDEITAKDFRTWGGTVIGAETLYEMGPFSSDGEAKKNIVQAVKTVSKELGNTTTVCRSYYIHPTVIASYEKKILIPHFEKARRKINEKPNELTIAEFATRTLLEEYK